MDLAALEVALRDLSHDDRAVQLVRSFAEGLGKTKQRQQIFNAPGALVRWFAFCWQELMMGRADWGVNLSIEISWVCWVSFFNPTYRSMYRLDLVLCHRRSIQSIKIECNNRIIQYSQLRLSRLKSIVTTSPNHCSVNVCSWAAPTLLFFFLLFSWIVICSVVVKIRTLFRSKRSEEHTSELQSLHVIS